jgi:mono/diheme cytochrome c family protein/glucose/arabinose dehydrogenase
VISSPFRLAALLFVLTWVRPAAAQFEEDGDLIPGLLGRYQAGSVTIERVDPGLSHDWEDAPPDERLPPGPFEVAWSSQLLLREESAFTFHAYVQGSVKVQIDGETVLAGDRADAGWVHGDPVELSFGLLELAVNYRKTQPQARVHLFWESTEFPLEPISPHLLFRDEPRPDLVAWVRGRELFEALRCDRCHLRESEPRSPTAPVLFHVTTGLNPDWLVKRLTTEWDQLQGKQLASGRTLHDQMPTFGFSAEEASAVAAWIDYFSQPVELAATPAAPIREKDDPGPGDLLLKSVGCLACHVVGQEGTSGLYGGGDLSSVGAKRSRDWIYNWLAHPERLNPQHQMPVFRLTPTQRARIATVLSERGETEATARDRRLGRKEATPQVEQGRTLAQRALCAACHKIPAMEADLARIPRLTQPVRNWDQSCLGTTGAGAAGDHQLRPWYPQLTPADRDALIAYVDTLGRARPRAEGRFELAQRLLRQQNCLACHERDLSRGMVAVAGQVSQADERLRGQSQALIPPNLTAVGDKLPEAALARALAGDPDRPRLPWLKVRMPRFRHTATETDALVAYLVAHDRIPDGSGAELTWDAAARLEEPTLLAGQALVSSGGFNCIACHQFGAYEPRNVALGTKGSDLLGLGARMRPSFFHRWTRAPLRIVPGMEMPNFNKPVHGVLDDDVDRQLVAVWRAVNDARFQTPTNPAQVEQLLVLRPGDTPRVIRDVFTVSPENGGGALARALAVGLGNGHSLLLDLDRFRVRGWTFGDFARQRTEGKSWYWDLAGVDLMRGLSGPPELLLRSRESGELSLPVWDQNRAARLESYVIELDVVRTVHTVTFAVGKEPARVRMTQEFREIPADDAAAAGGWSGVRRTLAATGVPSGWDWLIALPPAAVRVGDAEIVGRTDGGDAGPHGVNGAAGAVAAESVQLSTGERVSVLAAPADKRPLHLDYRGRIERLPTEPKPKPVLPGNESLITTLPGFTGLRLPCSTDVMPTALGWTERGELVVTSLRGHVFLARDGDGDGVEEQWTEFEEGLAAPFGVLPFEGGLLVAHKPELLWLQDIDGDGRCDSRTVYADGWGYSDNYHDWTTGPVRTRSGDIFLALGSDYQQEGRPPETTRWRGKVLRIDSERTVSPYAHELRFPQGIAVDARDRVFVTDQQGEQNCFNEINLVLPEAHYGVPSLYEETPGQPEMRAAVQVPHPWTRSVNGLFFVPENVPGPLSSFAGHAIGCEYNGRFLVRCSFDEVDGQLQGAAYAFSRPQWDDEQQTFLGPICGTVGPAGELYVGSIFDSGWLGGPNIGEVVRLHPNGDPPLSGVREVRATPEGFEIEFLGEVDRNRAADPRSFDLSGYTRAWEGAYATPDSGVYRPVIGRATVSADGRSVRLTVAGLRTRYVYELNCRRVVPPDVPFFPESASYTMNRLPAR